MLTWICLLLTASLAQVQAGSIRETRIYNLPTVNNMLLLLEAESEESSISFEDGHEDELKPYQFAKSLPFSLSTKTGGHWEVNEEAGYRVWRATVISKSAKSLGLVFSEFYIPPGGELYIIGQDKILGAFTGDVNNKSNGKFSTMPIQGETLLLEYYEPLADDNAKCFVQEKLGYLLRDHAPKTPAKKPTVHMSPEEVRLVIANVNHGFRSYTKNFGDSGSCNIDVACEKHIAGKRQINSVAMLLTGDGTRVCTGAFINNAKRDGRQLFLTAKHCMNEDPSNFILVFNYQVKDCGDRSQPPQIQSAHGLTLLHSWSQSDFAIAEVREHIPDEYNVYMAGWDLSSEPPENIYTIHHPTGDVKKISYYQGKTELSSWLEAPRTFHWKVPTWTKGSTEKGSSGAPMFNSRGLIVGHLHGGSASCFMPRGYDNFGALYYDWASGPTKETRLRDILNPTGHSVTALRGAYLAQLRKERRHHHHRSSSSSSSSVAREHRRHHRHHSRRHHPKTPNAPSASYEVPSMLTYYEEPSYNYQQEMDHHQDVSGFKASPEFRNRDVIDMLFQ